MQVEAVQEAAGGNAAGAEGAPAVQPPKPRFELTITQYVAPFTITSIGVTVLELGQVYRGPWQQHYWSSRGCLFRHAYPVGYAASKEVFGRTWRMSISAEETGPEFTVSDAAAGVSYSGPSPTKPWTDACLAHRKTQRISGPKFFGFTDVNMRLAIAVQYTAAELAYVQHGVSLPAAGAQQPTQQQQQQQEQQDVQQQMHKHQQQQQEQAQQPLRPVLQQLSPAELLARELECSTRGVGAATAAVLATTKSLGGVQHGSLAGLKQWLAADDRHREQLQAFLLHSEEIPQSSRHLPAWRDKWVPQILQQLQTPDCDSTS